MAAVIGASDFFKIVRHGLDVRSVQAHVRKPFRFLLCGELASIAEMRALLLSGHTDERVPFDAAACLETISAGTPAVTEPSEVKAAIFLGRRGDAAGADFTALKTLGVPILAVTVDPSAVPSGPSSPPPRTRSTARRISRTRMS